MDLDSFPVLNATVSHTLIETQSMSMGAIVIQFAKDCGKDQVCVTKANLDVKLNVSEGQIIVPAYLNEIGRKLVFGAVFKVF